MVVGRRQSTVSGRSGQPGPSAASRVQLALNTARGSAMVRSMKVFSVKDHRAKTKTASTDSAQVRLIRDFGDMTEKRLRLIVSVSVMACF